MNDKDDSFLIATANRVRNDDAEADRIGGMIASLLRLKRSPDHKDRWQTGWGTKTNQGVARSLLALFENESK